MAPRCQNWYARAMKGPRDSSIVPERGERVLKLNSGCCRRRLSGPVTIDKVRRIVAIDTTVIHQLCLNRHGRDLEVFCDFVLFLFGIVAAHHVVHEREGTQEFRSESALHLLTVTGSACRGEERFGGPTKPCAHHTITNQPGEVKTSTRIPP